MSAFWRRWLIVAAGITGLVGLAFASLAVTGATEALNSILDILYLSGDATARAGDSALFASGIMGAVMVGWAATMLVVLVDPEMSSKPVVWRALTVGLLSWFLVDGIVSVVVEAPGNLVLNIIMLVLYAPGLIATYPGRTRIA